MLKHVMLSRSRFYLFLEFYQTLSSSWHNGSAPSNDIYDDDKDS
jgi:hypothetical protein